MDVVASLLILAGALLTLIAGIGQLRSADLFVRMHSATKPATLGWVLVVGGAVLAIPSLSGVTKLVLALGLQFLTAPVAAHLVGRAAYRVLATRPDRNRTERLTIDELGEQLPPDELA
ncbi:MAG: monovalent cation/H(+) antiporter subunit G [Microthrixaceae bacterium]|nr:monovalent cation/H(+) antiporter subunit G [Microthrixaceae bacterium]